MRALLTLAALPYLAGCQPDCGSPAQLNGLRWQAFGNVIAWQTGETGAPPGTSPVNGPTTWAFDWPNAASPDLTVQIDDQPFPAQGDWNTVECGTFGLSFAGTYTSPQGVTHNLSAAGNWFVFDQTFEAATTWNETWAAPDGTVGTLQATDAAIHGQQLP